MHRLCHIQHGDINRQTSMVDLSFNGLIQRGSKQLLFPKERCNVILKTLTIVGELNWVNRSMNNFPHFPKKFQQSLLLLHTDLEKIDRRLLFAIPKLISKRNSVAK